MKVRESLDALFEYSTEGIIITNSNGEIIMINPTGERQFGYEKGELTGQKIEVLVPREIRKKHVQYRDNYYAQPHPRAMGQGIALHGVRKDGSEFPVEISLSNYRTPEGLFVIAFIIDITLRKQQEDQLRKAHEDLKHYTRELENSNAELENFAYISSHDLQEPLRKIQAFGDRLKARERDRLSEQGKEYVDIMLNAASRMQVLINDLLTFSRITTKARPFSEVSLAGVLKEVLDDLQISIQKTHAEITSGPLPVIKSDRTQMRQLFQNLISNAIKFCKEGEIPKLHISSRELVQNNIPMVELSFADNGIGFDEKYLDRIFTIFQRLEGRKYEGSGIGLAITNKIAARHHGTITARSKPGEGTTFIVTLPK